MNIKTAFFIINLRVWRHSVRSRWVCTRSEVSSRACVTFRNHNEYAWGQRLEFFVRSQNVIEGQHAQEFTSDLIQTHRDLTGWRHKQIDFKSVLIFLDSAQVHFCSAYTNSHWAIIDCHTPVILQLGEDKILIYLSKREFWPNTSYVLI